VRHSIIRSVCPSEQFWQSRKIEGRLAGFADGEGAGLLRRTQIRLAMKCAKPPALGVFDGITILQFEHLPGWEATSEVGPSLGHLQQRQEGGTVPTWVAAR
jgi:hypothetical protein